MATHIGEFKGCNFYLHEGSTFFNTEYNTLEVLYDYWSMGSIQDNLPPRKNSCHPVDLRMYFSPDGNSACVLWGPTPEIRMGVYYIDICFVKRKGPGSIKYFMYEPDFWEPKKRYSLIDRGDRTVKFSEDSKYIFISEGDGDFNFKIIDIENELYFDYKFDANYKENENFSSKDFHAIYNRNDNSVMFQQVDLKTDDVEGSDKIHLSEQNWKKWDL